MIAKIEGHFIGAKTHKDLCTKLSKIPLGQEEIYDMADYTGECWSFYVKHMMITPFNLKKRWTKLKLVQLFNERKNAELSEGKKYSEKSLTSKRLDKVIYDLVKMANNHGK